MKKTTTISGLLLINLFAFCLFSHAQKGVYVGAQVAPLLSVTFNGDDVNNTGMDYKAKTSYAAGLSAGYNFSKHFGAGVELMYTVEKQSYKDNLSGYTEKFQYLKIPVVLTYNTNPDALVMFTAKAGPQLGIMMKSTVSDAYNHSPEKDKYNSLHLGAMAGAGISLRLTDQVRVNTGLRFDGSITNLESKEYRQGFTSRPDTHHINAGIEVGIKYQFN